MQMLLVESHCSGYCAGMPCRARSADSPNYTVCYTGLAMSADLQRPVMAERIKYVPRTLRKSCSPHVLKSCPLRPRRAPELSETCPTIVERLLRETRFGRSSGNIGRTMVNIGQLWRTLAKRFTICWPTLANISESRSKLANMLIELGQDWAKCGNVGQTRPHLAKLWQICCKCCQCWPFYRQCWPNLGNLASPGTTLRQVLGKCWTTPELAGFAGGTLPGHVASNLSATFA